MGVRVLVVVGAAAFGFAMQSAAHLAADPGWGWLQWVVNWGALWVVIPFVVGRRCDRAPAAAFLGAVVGAIEVAGYYGPASLAGFQVAWLVIGAVLSAVVGLFGRWGRGHRWGPLGVPVALISEPIGMTGVFLLLGRHVGPHWFSSCAAELVVGLALGLLLLPEPRGRAM